MGLKADTAQTFGISLWKMQVLSVMFWGAGERENALNILKTAEDAARQMQNKVHESSKNARGVAFPSFWHGTWVSFDQFEEDCQEQRSMIRMGSSPSIRPPFLDDAFVR